MKLKIAVIGLGYVGLPLAISLGKYFETIGFDTNKERILNLNKGVDINNEFSKKQIKKSKTIFSNKIEDLKEINFFIITVPTPIYSNKKPNLSFVKKASLIVSKFLKPKSIVVFESTVYPGLTESYSLKYLKKKNELNCPGNDLEEKNFIKKKENFFYLGYSPERVNPGDNKRKLSNITKIISSNVKTSLNIINFVYKKVIKSKIYKVQNIRTAEAAKIIENTQRDLNIALFNEFSIIFNKLNLDSKQIFDAAETKWNFHRYFPGLVGGHCIGVDPYYLTYLSKKNNYKPQVILSGRSLNDNMHNYIFNEIKKIFIKKGISLNKSKILILGYTFKENCGDVRNSRTIELAKKFSRNFKETYLFDPVAVTSNLGIKKLKILKKIKGKYDLILIAVSHNQFRKYSKSFFKKHQKKNSVFADLNRLYMGKINSDFSL